jgi:hypothetical protein
MSGRSGRGGSGRVSQAIVVKVGMLALLTWVKAGRVGRKVEIGRGRGRGSLEVKHLLPAARIGVPGAMKQQIL